MRKRDVAKQIGLHQAFMLDRLNKLICQFIPTVGRQKPESGLNHIRAMQRINS